MFREEKRQFIHIALLILAFLLKYLGRFQAAGLLFLLFFAAFFIVPKLRVRLHIYRHFERKYSQGGIFYFLVLLILVLIFPLYILAASWAILALGDGMATLIGRHFKARELAWNKDKTYVGSLAFIIFGAFGAFILLKWMMPQIGGVFSIALKTAIVAAIIESLPLRINDNISVAVISAVTLSLLT